MRTLKTHVCELLVDKFITRFIAWARPVRKSATYEGKSLASVTAGAMDIKEQTLPFEQSERLSRVPFLMTCIVL